MVIHSYQLIIYNNNSNLFIIEFMPLFPFILIYSNYFHHFFIILLSLLLLKFFFIIVCIYMYPLKEKVMGKPNRSLTGTSRSSGKFDHGLFSRLGFGLPSLMWVAMAAIVSF